MIQYSDRPCYLVLTEIFLPTKGGTAVWFDEVYRRLGAESTHIVTNSVPGSIEHDANNPNTIHRLKLENSTWLRPASLPKYLILFFKSLWLALTHRFNGIHAGRVLPEGLVALIVARLTRHQCVIYAHGEEITTWRHLPRRREAMTFAYKHANRVIANSEFTRHQLLNLGVGEDRIAIISPGVDISRFHPNYDCADLRTRINCSENTKVVLSVGRLSRRKGFDNLIRALALMQQEQAIDFRYILIGIGEDRERLEALAQSQGIVNNVLFLGHVSMVDLPRWYNVCDVFAMPNREIDGDTEGFGMVFLEAAACGKPSLAGYAGGTGDAVLDGETGFRVDGSDVVAICSQLRRILCDDLLAANLAENAYRRAVEEFDWIRIAEKTLGACEDG